MSVEADITVLYLNNLGRFPDSGGLQHYINQRNSGLSLGDIANELRNSGEASNLRQMVTNAYRTFLGREPEPGAVDFHVRYSGNKSNDLIRAIRQSPEAMEYAAGLEKYATAYGSGIKNYANNDKFNYNKSFFPGFGTGSTQYLGALNHWNVYGKNAGRVIPAEPLIQIDSNGNLTTANRKYFSDEAWNRINNLVNNIKNSPGGNYKQIITNALNSLSGSNNRHLVERDFLLNTGIDLLGAYYANNKVDPWDGTRLGYQPPVGGFDAEYYKQQNPNALNSWNQNKSFYIGNFKFDNLDYTARYTEDSYLWQDYTNSGRYAGYRGSPAAEAKAATEYVEKLTDAELQIYRDQVLGLGPDTSAVDWEDETQSLLESYVQQTLQARDAQQQARFGALTKDVLKQATQELVKAKKQEFELDFYRGLPGFNEIFSINETMANSLIGDSGVGGVLSIIGGSKEKTTENLEEELSQYTGIPSRNTVLYNWQKWFDDELLKRYETMSEVADPEDAAKMYEVDSEFAQTFIDSYLKPRFDQSKSMDEFISYIDVTQEEQNIFQTQDAVNALKGLADVRAKVYYDQIKNATGGGFDSDFYMNPSTEDSLKKTLYEQQKQEVNKDWEDAKNRGNQVKVGEYTWDQWAYYYGLDKNDPNQFAMLHYQVKGMGQGFDPAKDVTSYSDAQNYITNTVVPAIEKANLEIGDQPFLEFVTPEEFADSLLESISPEEQREEWEELLKIYGLDSNTTDLQEVKDYIIEALRTNQAQEIRESIKYLNEKKLTPNQYRLGVSYIQRPEDKKDLDPESTRLYQIFKDSGYKGTEDDFYNEFMPDTSKEEQEFLTKALEGELEIDALSTSDPFEALTSVASLFGEDTDVFGTPTNKTKEDTSEQKSSYFKLFEDETPEEDYKSEAGKSYISEFTSLFKGF